MHDRDVLHMYTYIFDHLPPRKFIFSNIFLRGNWFFRTFFSVEIDFFEHFSPRKLIFSKNFLRGNWFVERFSPRKLIFRTFFLHWPPGVKLAATGVICPLGAMFTPSFTPRGEHSLLFRRMEGKQMISLPRDNLTSRGKNSPLGDNFTPGGQLRPWGTTSPLGDNFAPGGQFRPWGQFKKGPLGSPGAVVVDVVLDPGWTLRHHFFHVDSTSNASTHTVSVLLRLGSIWWISCGRNCKMYVSKYSGFFGLWVPLN
jgi:hypothetical protein